MTKRLFAVAIAIGLMFFGGCQKDEFSSLVPENPTLELKHGDVIPGQFIVVYKDYSDLKSSLQGTYDERTKSVNDYSEAIFAKAGVSISAIEHIYSSTIYGVSAKLSESELNQLKRDDRVAYVESDRFIMLDYEMIDDDGPAKAQTTPWGITRVGGFVNYTGTKKAWVLDTGIEYTHPELNVNTSLSKTFITTGPDGKDANDLNGHGTHVAGTIAAKDNTEGVVGVAAGATLVAVKVLDRRGSGSYAGVIKGVDYVGATATAGDVANMSLGGPVSQSLDDAVLAASNKGIWFSIAAGNDGKNANNYSPARVNGTYIYTISAMDSADKFASWSNWANPPIDWCAPGVSIYSTWIKKSYKTISGTSMAAPHAAGVRLLGTPKADGYVLNDPDGNPDPIIHR